MAEFDKILPVTEVKKRLLELLKQVQGLGGTIAITKNGTPAGVLIGIDEYEGLLETLDIMSSPETMAALKRAEADVAAGRTYSHEEVWDECDD